MCCFEGTKEGGDRVHEAPLAKEAWIACQTASIVPAPRVGG